MFGNAKALAAIEEMAGRKEQRDVYSRKADSIKQLSQAKLWNNSHQFFEVRKEAVSYIEGHSKKK